MLHHLEAFGPFSNLSLSDLRPSPSLAVGAAGNRSTSSSSSFALGSLPPPLSPTPMEGILIGGQRGLVLQFLGEPQGSLGDGGGTGDWGPGTKLVRNTLSMMAILIL